MTCLVIGHRVRPLDWTKNLLVLITPHAWCQEGPIARPSPGTFPSSSWSPASPSRPHLPPEPFWHHPHSFLPLFLTVCPHMKQEGARVRSRPCPALASSLSGKASKAQLSAALTPHLLHCCWNIPCCSCLRAFCSGSSSVTYHPLSPPSRAWLSL